MVWPRSGARHPRRWTLALTRVLPLALLAACGSGAPAVQRAADAVRQAPPHRVLLISLDGAGTDTFHDLYRQGLLREGGFERFFREGQVADALIPVDPTLTAVNHVSLATGFPPDATGIVGNQFLPGGSGTDLVNGFAAPIGTETLWEAARRQGRRVGVLGWPGADAKGERRTADWGLVFSDIAEERPQLVTLARADWQPGDPARPTARVAIGEEASKAKLALRLTAVDDRGDGGHGYDAVAITGEPADGGSTGAGATALLHAGEWRQVSWPRPDGPVASWVKLMALAPDLAETRLYVGPVFRTKAYPSRFAQELAGQGLYWPGPPDGGSLTAAWQGRPGIDVDTWTEQVVHLADFMSRALRRAAADPGWDLLLGYVSAIDDAGHRLLLLDPRQPDFSVQRRDDCARARLRVWQAVDRELAELLAGLDLTRTTVVVVSDHGMAPIHTSVSPNALLDELGLLPKEEPEGGAKPATPAKPATEPKPATGAKPEPISAPSAQAVPDGGMAQVYVDAEDGARSRVIATLQKRFAEWRIAGEAPVERVLTRQEAARLGLDHPNCGDLILFAREGYVFRKLPDKKVSAPATIYGGHGYLASHPDMRAVYLAIGAGIRQGSGGTVRATEVAPRVAAWLGMAPPAREAVAAARRP